jgi:hypothetical protein
MFFSTTQAELTTKVASLVSHVAVLNHVVAFDEAV